LRILPGQKTQLKCLGVHFGHDISKCQQSNIEKQFQKTKEIINSWNKRNLSIVGKTSCEIPTLSKHNLYSFSLYNS
jgi:hypothetical protein